MEFGEKLQQLRKDKGLTQEELAGALYVSRAAISKWESGRGYPSIDSLKAAADYFSVSVDELLSGRELLNMAEKDSRTKVQHIRDMVFGLLDCAIAMFLFLPFFGQTVDGVIYEIPLMALTESEPYVKGTYIVLVFATILWGVATLALQSCSHELWNRCKAPVSVGLSVISSLFFIASMQPYAAMQTFIFLLIKGYILIKRP